ncbi:hypothetical protein THAOC_01640 [Thalassiosira oceanica]|uniref:Chitin-binding type-3 domain-containing protein n=1 Tax=Thalassiosira oceanica TaxID=159749 RepID=K0TD12_THAOC|nr:hypothetical protein THAOC_01640 [Thalassiosira oceanica]|eukprot:EJK76588.1 hypothetical protein THAOC_01640 [Thalassiosira oceanica]
MKSGRSSARSAWKVLYREPLAWGSRNGPRKGPGRFVKRASIEHSALIGLRQRVPFLGITRPAAYLDDRVVRTKSTRSSELDEKVAPWNRLFELYKSLSIVEFRSTELALLFALARKCVTADDAKRTKKADFAARIAERILTHKASLQVKFSPSPFASGSVSGDAFDEHDVLFPGRDDSADDLGVSSYPSTVDSIAATFSAEVILGEAISLRSAGIAKGQCAGDGTGTPHLLPKYRRDTVLHPCYQVGRLDSQPPACSDYPAYDPSATYQAGARSGDWVSDKFCKQPSDCGPAIYQCNNAANCNTVGPFPHDHQATAGWTFIGFCQGPTTPPTRSPIPLPPTPKPTAHHAGGCHPPYSAGADYAAGQQVSATATTETPGTTPCTCSDASCPNNPGQTTGCTKTTTVTTSETYNYQCVDSSNPNWHYCKNPGFEPTGLHGGLAWVKGAQCSGIITPVDLLKGLANPPGCPEDFVAGTEYEPDAKVSTSIAGHSGPAKQIYICAAEPMNQFCGQEHYEPGMGQHWNLVWTEGSVCFGSVSPTASPSWDAARMIDGCPGAWAKGTNIYEPGDRVSKNGIVFECSSGEWSAHCSSEGYEPDVDSETDYWQMVWTVLGRCTGTIAPTGSPTFDQATVTGCPDDWAKGTTYEEGDLAAVTVSSTPLRKIAYRCKKWPFDGHCSMYSPEEVGGDLGWTKVGGCAGTISPTAAPSFDALALVGGCPDNYSTAAEYEAGDRVAFQAAAGTAGSTSLDDGWRFIVYECKDWPSSPYCSQDAYKPGSQYDYMAWTVKGHCDGTLPPTAAPTAYSNIDCPISAYSECTYEAGLPTPATTIPQCKYNKEVEVTGVACNCGDSGCPTPSPTSTTCTKTVTRNSCPAVNNWSSGVSYDEGDVVRVANNMYTCKGWPFDFNCSNQAYKPTTDPGGLWEQSWTASGTCPIKC